MGIVQSAVNWVFQKVRTVISTISNWLVRTVEPVVSHWIGKRVMHINSTQNPESFGKAVACNREKREIDIEYQKNRRLLSASDKSKLDNLTV